MLVSFKEFKMNGGKAKDIVINSDNVISLQEAEYTAEFGQENIKYTIMECVGGSKFNLEGSVYVNKYLLENKIVVDEQSTATPNNNSTI